MERTPSLTSTRPIFEWAPIDRVTTFLFFIFILFQEGESENPTQDILTS